MSLRAILWALEDANAPTSTATLVLIAFANYANEHNMAYPSLEAVRRLTKLDIRSLRKSVALLESAGLLIDTGYRKGRIKNVRVFALPVTRGANMHGLDASAGEKASETKALEGPENPTPTNMPLFDEMGANPGNNEGVTPTNMPYDPVKDPTPDKPNGLSAPKGAGNAAARGHRISEDWLPPHPSTLPPTQAAIVAAWPEGAYADQADAFRDHWSGEDGVRARKVDWGKAWLSWIRKAKNVKAPAPMPKASPAAEVDRSEVRTVVERDAEGEAEGRLRAALEGTGTIAGTIWLQACGLRLADPGLEIFVPAWARGQVEALQPMIERVALSAGFAPRWISVLPGTVRR